VALFTDSFAEANGVATVSRQFVEFATRHQLPFFCVHSGPKTELCRQESVTTLELKRGLTAFPLDHDLFCDPLLSRYRNRVLAAIRPFQPDLVQITGPGDMGIMGAWIAHLLHVPLVASWHTNLHEYAGRRLDKTLSFLPDAWRIKYSRKAEEQSLRACMWFYHYARFTLAPNQAMVNLLTSRTGRPSFLMPHGVDTALFSPSRRKRRDATFRIGYVGRLTPEKNVRLLADLSQALATAGHRDFRVVMVGDGGEREWLRKRLRSGELPGILRGEALAEAFADMDVFVFPSRTDTFGLVLLEAMASGVPVVVSPETGARVDIRHGVTGFLADDLNGFVESVVRLLQNRTLLNDMGRAARNFSCSMAWDGVFDQVYRTYEVGLEMIGRGKRRLAEVPVAQ
jgi:glycosyltransferase involved in cell wall biosynthesis